MVSECAESLSERGALLRFNGRTKWCAQIINDAPLPLALRSCHPAAKLAADGLGFPLSQRVRVG